MSLINQPIQPETREQNSLQLHLKRYTFQITKCGTEGGRGYGGAEQSLFLLLYIYITAIDATLSVGQKALFNKKC